MLYTMKKLLLIILFALYYLPSFANHISGGELFYEYLGPGSSSGRSRYKVTMRLFRDCNSTGQTLDMETVKIAVYSQSTGSYQDSLAYIKFPPTTTISLNTSAIPCLVNAPDVCFQIGIFSGTI